MDSRPDLFIAYAGDCRRRAEAARERRSKALFESLAAQWEYLASLIVTLETDREALRAARSVLDEET